MSRTKMYYDVRVGPGVMLRVRRTLGGWVWEPEDGGFRYFFRRTTTASHWRVVAQGGKYQRDVTSLRQCAWAAREHWLEARMQQDILDGVAVGE